MTTLTAEHRDLLVDLVSTSTVTPMETGESSALAAAQELLVAGARPAGGRVELHEPPPATVLDDDLVPAAVLARAEAMGAAFLDDQPNLVLRYGVPRPRAQTLMFNAHVDTVGDHLPVRVADGVLHGRGAVDMKGPAVAVLAGIERALGADPTILDRATILLHAVGGEEGGALGVYGTRAVVARGLTGALNVFAEPTSGRYLDRCTSSMTGRLDVHGASATDDACERATNATVLLGWLAADLPRRLDRRLREHRARLCVGGLHTGSTHDRAYGDGQLLFNVIYADAAGARALEDAIAAELPRCVADFARELGHVAELRETARTASETLTLTWLKRRIPVLANRAPSWEALLAQVGAGRADADGPAPFTCDAIWAPAPDAHVVVLGPGDLGRDGAHTDDEHVALDELDGYGALVARLVAAFADGVA